MSRYRLGRRFLGELSAVALTFCLAISIPLHGQVAGTGTIQGVVTDPSGAFLPGATVTLTEESTKVVHTAKTDSAGAYGKPLFSRSIALSVHPPTKKSIGSGCSRRLRAKRLA